MSPPRVAVVCDLLEEKWPSMDLVAEMLLRSVREGHAERVSVSRICPPMRYRFTPLHSLLQPLGRWASDGQRWFNADRALNRFLDYPLLLRRVRREYDLFHVVDHAYGQLVHALPASRTVVTCHDLHTFQCLLEPESGPRSGAFRAMTRRILDGLTRAARVVFDTAAVRDEVLGYGLLPPERTRVVHLGVHPAFAAHDPQADAAVARLLGEPRADGVDILHVGGTFARKRIDLLLEIVAAVRAELPGVRLIRVGGELTPQQQALAERLGVADAIVPLPFITREELAAVYRRAALVLIPSEVEGFGLPLVEAMTCGAPVVASALPVLMEVGESAATFCPVGDIPAWRDQIVALLRERAERPEAWAARREAGRRQAAKFTWSEYARKMVDVYHEVLSQ